MRGIVTDSRSGRADEQRREPQDVSQAAARGTNKHARHAMTPPPDHPTTQDDDDPKPREPDVDEASEESFPASDPPSYGAPETGGDRD
jgi:hypothetical protein